MKAAMRILSSSEASVLSVNDSINTTNAEGTRTDEIKAKHPPWNKVNPQPDAVLSEPERDFHPVSFDCIDAESIWKAALQKNGVARPSGADDSFWKWIYTSFQLASDDICASFALVEKRLTPH